MLGKLQSVKERVEKIRFQLTTQQVQSIAPIEYRLDSAVTIVSMVSHNTLNMYLISIASFMRNFGYGTIEVINDGTLNDSDIEQLRYIIPSVKLTNANDIDTHGCPNYSSWKRLFRIIQLVESSYVIQLDSDIISLMPLQEIHQKVKDNAGFVIGSNIWADSVDVSFLQVIAEQWDSDHVQTCAERVLSELDYFKDGTRYLRGCAGFCGYPLKSITLEQILSLSGEISAHIGESKWASWGSEQTATLCLISKSKQASVLPWPAYQNYMFPVSNEPIESMKLIHFIGTNRFRNSSYRKLACILISDLPKDKIESKRKPLLEKIISAME